MHNKTPFPHLILTIGTIALSARVTAAPSPGAQQEIETPAPFIYALQLRGAYSWQGGEPDTTLNFDDDTGLWQLDSLMQPNGHVRFPSAGLSLNAEWEPWHWMIVQAWLDSGELRDGATLDPPVDGITSNGAEVIDEATQAGMVRELSVAFGTPAASLSLGRHRQVVADGLVYDDFGTGAAGRIDFDAWRWGPWSAEAFAVAVGTRADELTQPSPLLALKIDWQISLFESASLFAAHFRDRQGLLQDVVGSAWAEGVITSDFEFAQQNMLSNLFSEDTGTGHLTYAGAQAHLILAPGVSARGAAVLSTGTFTLPIAPSVERTLNLRGLAASAELHWGLGRDYEVGAFGMYLSGDAAPTVSAPNTLGDASNETYSAFIGVAPYWVWTGLFFSGGVTQGFYAGRATAAGVNGHGVYGGGPTFYGEYAGVIVEGRAAWLQAPIAAPSFAGTGSTYGIEVDWMLEWAPIEHVVIAAEADLFWPGNYFPSQDFAYRVLLLLGVDYASPA